MILGIGNDLCDSRRIARVLALFGDRFLARIFTDFERGRAAIHSREEQKVAFLTKRFSAKEACAKALGTGMACGVGWKDIEVGEAPNGRPILILQGGARECLRHLTPAGMEPYIHLSLTDEPPLASAMVVISAEPSLPPVYP